MGNPGRSRFCVAYPLLAVVLSLCAQSVALAEWYQQQQDIMSTRISVELWHAETAVAADCSQRVFAEIERINALMSSYLDSSELSFINNNAAIDAVEISDELALLVERSLYFSEISKGAFDITYASIGYAYDYRKRQQPSD